MVDHPLLSPWRRRALRSIALLMSGLLAATAPVRARSLLFLPLEIDSSQVPEHAAYQRLFKEAMEARFPGQVVITRVGTENCFGLNSARDLAKTAKASHVVFGSVRDLGLEVYFKATLADAAGKGAHSGLVSLSDPEQIESAAWNLAEALVKRQPVKAPSRGAVERLRQVAAKEAPRTHPGAGALEPSAAPVEPGGWPSRYDSREEGLPAELPPLPELPVERPSMAWAVYSTGVSVGYAPPLGGNYGRWKYRRECEGSLIACPDSAIYFQTIIGLKVGWRNWLDLGERYTVETDVIWYAPLALGADLNLAYRFSGGAFTPFAGGGIGAHYVYPDEGRFADGSKRNLGMAFNLQGGLVLFKHRTLNAVTRLQFHQVMNADADRSLSTDIAIRSSLGGGAGRGFGATPTATWVGLGLGGVFFLNLALGLAGY